MTEEYGPPIAVNGKRPEWLGDYDWCQADGKDDWHDADHAINWDWPNISRIRLQSSHPYYQSAEYKESAQQEANTVLSKVWAGQIGAGQLPMTEAEMIAALEATGHTVTPPDPLAADREFLAGLCEAVGWWGSADFWRNGEHDDKLAATMDYLRQNKGRL